MPSIGSVSCDYVHGPLFLPLPRLEQWTTPGLHGFGLMNLGNTAREGQLRAVYYGTFSDCETWLASLEALVGAGAVAVENDIGESDSYVQVLDVQIVSQTPAFGTEYSDGKRYEALVSIRLDS